MTNSTFNPTYANDGSVFEYVCVCVCVCVCVYILCLSCTEQRESCNSLWKLRLCNKQQQSWTHKNCTPNTIITGVGHINVKAALIWWNLPRQNRNKTFRSPYENSSVSSYLYSRTELVIVRGRVLPACTHRVNPSWQLQITKTIHVYQIPRREKSENFHRLGNYQASVIRSNLSLV